MFWVTMILTLVLGFIAAAPRFTAKSDGLKAFVEAIGPAEGWIGLGALVWTFYQLVYLLLHLGIFRVAALFAIVYLLVLLMLGALSFLLAHAVLGNLARLGPLPGWHDSLARRRVSLGTSAMTIAVLNMVFDLLQ